MDRGTLAELQVAWEVRSFWVYFLAAFGNVGFERAVLHLAILVDLLVVLNPEVLGIDEALVVSLDRPLSEAITLIGIGDLGIVSLLLNGHLLALEQLLGHFMRNQIWLEGVLGKHFLCNFFSLFQRFPYQETVAVVVKNHEALLDLLDAAWGQAQLPIWIEESNRQVVLSLG